MSICTMNFFASTLNFRTEVRVALPEYPEQRAASTDRRRAYDRSIRFPVVYLLHGYTGDYTDWLTMVPIERYAQAYGMAVVMPHGYNSWYMNLPHGPRVEDFIADELPAAMEALLPIADCAEERFIAGLSMGGMGAVSIVLKHPERYRACASASGVMSRGLLEAQYAEGPDADPEMLERLHYASRGGEEPEIEELYLRLKRENASIPPHLFLYGEQDEMFDRQYRWFTAFAKSHGLPVTAACWQGAHDFGFWDPAVQRMFEWFGTRRSTPDGKEEP